MEDDIDVREEIQAPSNSNLDEEFVLHDIVDWFHFLKKMLNLTIF